jgi:hypothetical protein
VLIGNLICTIVNTCEVAESKLPRESKDDSQKEISHSRQLEKIAVLQKLSISFFDTAYYQSGSFPAVASTISQCCQVAEISAKKLKRGRGKIKLPGRICGRILAEFTKSGRKGAGEYFLKKFLI